MPQHTPDFTAALESYLRHLAADRHASVPETSRYGYLQTLLNVAGADVTPSVRAVIHPANSGAGIPDLGLYAEDQPEDARPSHGVVEAKPTSADIRAIANSQQVLAYLHHYRLVLVTNYSGFLLVTLDENGQPRLEETYRLAENEATFWQAAENPRGLAQRHAPVLLEYLMRVMSRHAPLRTPQEVAGILASYAREARARLDSDAIHQPTLRRIREQMEEALGIHFKEEQGESFFRSSLVQTIFYGLFSAWVIWHEENPARTDAFDLWRHTRHLNVPAVQLLFEQFTAPSRLTPLNIEEVLQWTAAALNRVARGPFFAAFGRAGGESDSPTAGAVQYFYEPFLEAFDPELRRQLGVWYTPPEVVDYMTARVDAALRDELGIADGLADPQVVVLDPCCGTGAYLVSVMRLIYRRLRERNGAALAGQQTAEAVRTRLFGFEILPAPFVVAHLQIGMLLAGEMAAPLRPNQRAGVFLTNALTGWDENLTPPTLSNNILAEEYEAAQGVKQESQILVVLGNPPYSGYAGLAVDEERGLVDAYRETKGGAPRPQGQGLNDLYVRFYRMAERRIVEMTRRGVVCFISNYSWLDGLSHTGMRERYLREFDSVWIDNLHGDRIISERAPDGRSSATVFAIRAQSPGIKVGTAIALLVRKEQHATSGAVYYRDHHAADADERRANLLATLDESNFAANYQSLEPELALGLPLKPRVLAADYLSWPKLPELFPQSFPGVQTSRDSIVVDIDKRNLIERMQKYFDPALADATVERLMPDAMRETQRFAPREVRLQLLRRGFLSEKILPHAYRPFDLRWLYWEPETKLLDEKRTEYVAHVRTEENVWFTSQQKARRSWDPPQFVRQIGARHLEERGANLFPLYLYDDDPNQLFQARHDNTSPLARRYLAQVGGDAPALFYHALAVLHSPAYRLENSGGLRQDWPRLPLPHDDDALADSAALGRAVAGLLDPEAQVDGVTRGAPRPDLREIALFDAAGNPPDLAVHAGWGYGGRGGVVMPGRGRLEERANSAGEPIVDVYLNDSACWRGVPLAVWEYTLGGYPVLKKWLSYREDALLGRSLHPAEVAEFMRIARRIAALLALAEELDGNYRRVAGLHQTL